MVTYLGLSYSLQLPELTEDRDADPGTVRYRIKLRLSLQTAEGLSVRGTPIAWSQAAHPPPPPGPQPCGPKFPHSSRLFSPHPPNVLDYSSRDSQYPTVQVRHRPCSLQHGKTFGPVSPDNMAQPSLESPVCTLAE